MRLFLVLGFACVATSGAAGQARGRWTSIAIGAGAAGVTSTTRDVYQDSPQVFMRLGYAWTTDRPFAFEVEALGGSDFGTGDCLTSFSGCPPPGLHFVGASANALWASRGRVEANRSLVGAGLGLSRIAPTQSHRVSPRAAPSVAVIAEAPVLVGSKAALTLGLRGIAFPFVHGESVYMGLLTVGFRRW
jgi:hypothetical protein